MGTESAIANIVDVLLEFARLIAPEQPQPPRTTHLFDKGVQIPRWEHLWDNILRRTLSALDLFGDWLAKLKALSSFLRSVTTCHGSEQAIHRCRVPCRNRDVARLASASFRALAMGNAQGWVRRNAPDPFASSAGLQA